MVLKTGSISLTNWTFGRPSFQSSSHFWADQPLNQSRIVKTGNQIGEPSNPAGSGWIERFNRLFFFFLFFKTTSFCPLNPPHSLMLSCRYFAPLSLPSRSSLATSPTWRRWRHLDEYVISVMPSWRWRHLGNTILMMTSSRWRHLDNDVSTISCNIETFHKDWFNRLLKLLKF